jgi:hypothetical protein
MKKYNLLLIPFLLLSILPLTGCDDPIPLNIPITVNVALSGANLTTSRSFCLDDFESYQDISDDINSLTYLEGALRVDSISNENLTGDILVELRRSDNQSVLFAYTLSNVRPANFKNTPYIFPLSAAQIQLLNNYIASISNGGNACFTATVAASNVTGGNPPYYIGAVIDMVFEAETEL